MNLYELNKARIAKNIQESYVDLEKGKKANIGEVREWDGKKFQKTASGDWKEVKDSEKNISIEFQFSSSEDFNKAHSILIKSGFRNSNSGNPPKGDEKGSFTPNDRFKSITVTRNSKEAKSILRGINSEQKEKKPMSYHIHNHGGHLD
jgi:hypothetical protein